MEAFDDLTDPGLGEFPQPRPRRSRVEIEAHALYEAILREGKALVGAYQYAIIRIRKEGCDFEDPFKVGIFDCTGETYVVLAPSKGAQGGTRDHQKIVLDIYISEGVRSEVINVPTLAEVILFFHVVILEFLRIEDVEDVGLFRRGDSYFPVRSSTMSTFGLDLERFLSS